MESRMAAQYGGKLAQRSSAGPVSVVIDRQVRRGTTSCGLARRGEYHHPRVRVRHEYIPVGSARAIRPPWTAEVPKLQEQISALARDAPARGW